MNGIRCFCIDDANRPKEIPASKWVKKGEKYHIVHVFKHLSQKGIQGVELAEIDISDCEPYNCFRLTRFAILLEDLEKLMQLMKDCTELSDIDISALLENLELVELEN